MRESKTTPRIAVISYATVKRELLLLLNLSRLTTSTSQVVELSTANLPYAVNFNLLNVGRMDRESLLYANTVRNLSNSEGLGDTAAMLSDYGTVEHLSSGLLSLGDADVNLYAITNVELRNLSLKLLIYKSLDLFHFMALLNTTNIRAELAEDCSENTPLYANRHTHSCKYCTIEFVKNQ